MEISYLGWGCAGNLDIGSRELNPCDEALGTPSR
jgi:hypothetical protein